MKAIKQCEHLTTCEGPRLPRLYGTSPSEICVECGAYRHTLHVPGEWKNKSIQYEFIEAFLEEEF